MSLEADDNEKRVEELKEKFAETVDAFLKITKEVSDRIDILKEKETQWHGLVENVGKKYADQNKVTLNVGGTHFVTMRSTLLRFENTYFSALLGTEGRWKSEEEDGSYFLDRNPMGFDYVLDYMRDGDLKNFKVIKPEVLAKFKEHLEYLLLPLPPVLEAKKENQWSKKACSRKLVVEGKVLTKAVGDGDYNSGALGTAPNPKSWKIKVLSARGGFALVGLAPKSRFDVNEKNHYKCGYYIFLKSGYSYSELDEDMNGHPYRNATIENGSIIEVLFNQDRREISFSVDGTNHGVAFTIPQPLTEPLFPAVDISQEGITLLMLS